MLLDSKDLFMSIVQGIPFYTFIYTLETAQSFYFLECSFKIVINRFKKKKKNVHMYFVYL